MKRKVNRLTKCKVWSQRRLNTHPKKGNDQNVHKLAQGKQRDRAAIKPFKKIKYLKNSAPI